VSGLSGVTTANMGAAQFPVILTYHSISEGDPPLQVSPHLFAEQMEWLRGNARVTSLGEVVDALSGRKPLPERTVVLTFDDGYSDFYSSAAPVLRRLKFPATIFVPTGLCGGADRSSQQSGWVSPQPLLDWDQVAALAKEGFSFGAHSITHPALPNLSTQEAKHEISGGKTQLEEHTGQTVEFFAYPYGRWSPGVRAMVQAEYRGACSTGAGVVEPDADPFALPRVDVHYLRRPAAFRMLFTAPFLAYVATRRLIRRIRHQPEGFYARV
jgi:peptidoglycan/xylan/chitin deacetylase (PgdA/CDA1 family)